MNDSRGVSFRQTLGDVLQISQQLCQICPLLIDDLPQCLAVDEFHGDEIQSIVFADFVNVSDVRMVEGGGGLRFLNEAAHAIAVTGEIGRENLECNLAAELGIFSEINFAHSARADLRANFVMLEFCS